MDYIYRDSNDIKCIGEIRNIKLIQYYVFNVQLYCDDITCHLYKIDSEWILYIPDMDIKIEIAHPIEVSWNVDALGEVFELENNNRIAYAIKKVFLRYNKKYRENRHLEPTYIVVKNIGE